MCVNYNPFRQAALLNPKRMANAARALSLEKAKSNSAVAMVTAEFRTAQQPEKPVIRTIRPPSSDSSLSDWTDCDEEEFTNMVV